MAHKGGGLLQRLEQDEFLQHQQGEEVQPPEQEGPVGPVPDAGGGPDHEQVEHLPALAPAVAPQGDIEIFPEPGGQGDVPPPPELGDAFGDIGVVEVGQELKTQHPPQAHGHVGVAGEIEINLEGEGQHPQPGPGNRQLRQGHGLVAVPQGPHVVGDEQLFSETNHKDLHAGGEFIRRAGPLVDLVPQVLVLDDGSGDKLGE